MYNEVSCENEFVPSHDDGMKQTIMILSDEIKKAREMAVEINKELFGGNPQNIKEPNDIMCAQDVLIECRSVSEQNLAILYDILRGIKGDVR